jgi:hypothetical protein
MRRGYIGGDKGLIDRKGKVNGANIKSEEAEG